MAYRKKKSSLSIINKIILAGNIMAALLLVASYLAPFADPASFWPIAFVGLAYPPLLILNIVFVLYWLLKRAKIALISFLVIAAGWQFLLDHIGFREPTSIGTPKSSAEFIRIMTYNIHYFKKMDNVNSQVVRDQMLDIIRKEQPDVVCFQEFMTHNNKDIDMEKAVKDILGSPYFYFLPHNDYYEQIGLAIFSKFPIKDKGSILFPDTYRGNEALYVDIEFNKQRLRVYNVHFQSIAFQPRDYKFLDEVKDINPDVTASRRIGSRIKRAFIKRSEQVKFLKKHTENCKTPFVVAGDFNDTPLSYAVNKMSEDMNNAFREKGSGFGVTYNGDFPNFQIDYILATKEFEIKNYRIIDKKLSDHYAVRSDLELK